MKRSVCITSPFLKVVSNFFFQNSATVAYALGDGKHLNKLFYLVNQCLLAVASTCMEFISVNNNRWNPFKWLTREKRTRRRAKAALGFTIMNMFK